jgi:usherin
MSRLALSLGFGLFFQVIETLIFACFASLSLAISQGLFPKLENVGAFKNASIVPARAVCGIPGRSTFCHSSEAAENLQLCTQQFCVQDCPYRSSSPTSTTFFSADLRDCITEEHDLHPHSHSNSTAFVFGNNQNCFSSLPSLRLVAAFTLAVWLKPEQDGIM